MKVKSSKDSRGQGQALTKNAAAKKWCRNASNYVADHDGKRWKCLLISHDGIAANMAIEGLAVKFGYSEM